MSLETAIENLAAAINKLADAATSDTSDTATPAESEPAPRKRKRSTKAETETETAKTEAKDGAKPDPEPEPEAKTETKVSSLSDKRAAKSVGDAPDLSTVRSAVIEVVNTLGRERGAELLSQFSAAKIGDVKVADYSALVDAARALVKDAANG